jgi:hypothetical protein
MRRTRLRRRAALAALPVALALAVPPLALGHALILSPLSRTGADFYTSGPCGVGRVGPTTVLRAGSVVAVRWRMDITHPPQSFSISFAAAGDRGFSVLRAGIPAPRTGVPVTTRVKLPDRTTTRGTIQLIQHGSPPDEHTYYSCSNIRLTPRR